MLHLPKLNISQPKLRLKITTCTWVIPTLFYQTKLILRHGEEECCHCTITGKMTPIEKKRLPHILRPSQPHNTTFHVQHSRSSSIKYFTWASTDNSVLISFIRFLAAVPLSLCRIYFIVSTAFICKFAALLTCYKVPDMNTKLETASHSQTIAAAQGHPRSKRCYLLSKLMFPGVRVG